MRPRWLVVALIASAALNLFLIGAAAGIVALGMRMAREGAGARPGPLIVASQDMPQPGRKNLRQMLRAVRAVLRSQTDESRALRIAAWDSIADTTPDAAAIDQKLEQSRQIDIVVRTKVESALVAYIVRQPAADRTAFAAGMHRVLTPPPPPPQPASPPS